MKRLINHIVVIFSICSETRHRHVIWKLSTSQNRRQMFAMMLPSFNELTCQIHQNTENSCIHTRFPVYNHNTREASLHVSNFVKKYLFLEMMIFYIDFIKNHLKGRLFALFYFSLSLRQLWVSPRQL